MTSQRRSLPVLERLVAERNYQEAFQAVMEILNAIDERYGKLEQVELNALASDGTGEDRRWFFARALPPPSAV